MFVCQWEGQTPIFMEKWCLSLFCLNIEFVSQVRYYRHSPVSTRKRLDNTYKRKYPENKKGEKPDDAEYRDHHYDAGGDLSKLVQVGCPPGSIVGRELATPAVVALTTLGNGDIREGGREEARRAFLVIQLSHCGDPRLLSDHELAAVYRQAAMISRAKKDVAVDRSRPTAPADPGPHTGISPLAP